jgi:hypothetical protein
MSLTIFGNKALPAYVSLPGLCLSPSITIVSQPPIVDMDRASQVLTEGFPVDLPQTWAARSKYAGVPLRTFYCRARGRPSEKEKAQQQQYLTSAEEEALVAFLLLMSNLGYPVRIKYIPSLALAEQRSPTANPPGKNWPRAFEKRYPQLKARTVNALD